MATQEIVCAGFGGQGVMSMGQLLTYAGMIEGKHVSWLPSYGPEMRGGTANCGVVVSDHPVGSPIVTDSTAAIVMNLPSLFKFEKTLVKDGLLLVNSSLIDKKTSRDDVKAYYIPANEMANELGNGKVANMIMLGAFLEITKTVKIESILAALKKVFGPSKEHLLPLNKEALEKGAMSVRS
ncbi:2-oxoacid:acceptor oxidoreductase family protein [Crassaminicella profunda]|uniref:2-oxoacid:acceptor oxidoreductase family protein n=1 Tax=Crassaminicella profunda TaxID=1286698 RepID=UPI001CA5F487|nr:2-oxoacid:acceptor oxidoreductase family protein [Crassaminicella profunda]QZY55596.1 2-oxoacid:acceptor oxidoreductase family protein [Crassaminicella profunda]